jgi:hypothetical protein
MPPSTLPPTPSNTEVDKFAADPQLYISKYNDDLVSSFSAFMMKRHAGKEVGMASVYQENIQDRSHVHLSVRNTSLSVYIIINKSLREIRESKRIGLGYLAESGVCETFEDERDSIIVWKDTTKPVGKRAVERAVKRRSQHETELDEIAAQVKRVKDAAALLDIEV